MTLHLVPEADNELMDIASWYERQQRGLGREFLALALDGFAEIEKTPSRFPRLDTDIPLHLRRYRLQRFPHGIIYEIRKQDIRVLAIAHPSRDPNYWVSRLD
jgi:plasmid stabilization system protein ParE